MRTYQTLSLIGCILGMVFTIGLFVLESALFGTSEVFLNMSKTLSTNTTQNTINQQQHNATKAALSPFMSGLAFSFLLYIAGIVITFVVKNTRRRTVSVQMTISGQVHDSHSIIVQVQTFAPSGYLVNLSQYTVPADAPDPATTTTGTSFVPSEKAPAGTFKIVAVTSDGQSISTTFEAPDCSATSGNTVSSFVSPISI